MDGTGRAGLGTEAAGGARFPDRSLSLRLPPLEARGSSEFVERFLHRKRKPPEHTNRSFRRCHASRSVAGEIQR